MPSKCIDFTYGRKYVTGNGFSDLDLQTFCVLNQRLRTL